MKRRAVILILIVSLSVLLAACSSGNLETIVVEDVWGRPSPKSAANAAFYMVIRNSGQEDDALTQAAVDICGLTELHRTTIDEAGVMSMGQVQQIDVPAGESVALEPGGLHVMCIDRQSELNPGDRFSVSLSFAKAGEMVVEAEIREQ